jgi:hypothetical protein
LIGATWRRGGRSNDANTYTRVLAPTLKAASEKLKDDVTWRAGIRFATRPA